MGLNPGDQEKVKAMNLSFDECYERVYKWHKVNSHRRASDSAYLELVNRLPEPPTASESEMAEVFRQVICGQLEWAYHQEDEYGAKTGAYAHEAMDMQFGGWTRYTPPK